MGKRIPNYRLHKPSGQAVVTLSNRDFYLGPYGSEDSRRKYGELIAKQASGVAVDPFRSDSPKSTLMIKELCVAFLDHADRHYLKNGQPTSEMHCIKAAIRPLLKFYGETAVDDFGPLMLKTVRMEMVSMGWVRNSVNRGIGRIRHIFRWAVANELVQPQTLQKLEALAPLLAGRTEARDNPPRSAVSEADIDAVRQAVSPLVRDLIDIQRLTGARSGELLSLTANMIDRANAVWLAVIENHKNIHHGKKRIIAIGPKAQAILSKYMAVGSQQNLFDIRRDAYCRSITRACDRMGITRWVPHQLRHTAAEAVRETFGLDHAQSVLGHSTADMSEHYAKIGVQKAVEVARVIG